MLDWDAGGGEGWQAELWRAVSAGSTEHHAATLWRRFHEALAGPDTNPEKNVQRPTLNVQRSTFNPQSTIRNPQSAIRNQNPLPERVAIFGVSALPPFYLDLFAA